MDVKFDRVVLVAVSFFVCLALSACGGGGDGGGSTNSGGDPQTSTTPGGTGTGGNGTGGNGSNGGGGSQTDPVSIDNTLTTGQFIDSPVAGLAFNTATQSGITDILGAYQYLPGETVSYSLGDILLGQTTAAPIITPVALVPDAIDESNLTVINIARFIQSLDQDQDLSNGIVIEEAIRSAAIGKTLDFSAADFEVKANALLLELTSGVYVPVRTLVSQDAAQQHLRTSLLFYLSGIYEGTIAGGDSGTWRLVLGIDGSVTGTITGNLVKRQVVAGSVSSSGDISGTGPGGTETLEASVALAGMLTGSYTSLTGASLALVGKRVSLPGSTDPIGTIDPGTGTDPGTGSGSTTDPTPGTSPGTTPGTSPGTSPGTGQDPVIPLGQLDLFGNDTRVIGDQFIPDTGYHGVNAIQYKINGGSSGFTTGLVILNLSEAGDLILATFSWANGNLSTPATLVYTYSMYCLAVTEPSDCSTVSINTTDKTVTFTNAVMDRHLGDATDSLLLNGTLDYLPLP